MSDNKNVDNIPEKGQLEPSDTNLAVAASELSSVAGSVKSAKVCLCYLLKSSGARP